MQNTIRWRSDQFQPTHIWNPWSNETNANLEDSACTVRVLLFFPMNSQWHLQTTKATKVLLPPMDNGHPERAFFQKYCPVSTAQYECCYSSQLEAKLFCTIFVQWALMLRVPWCLASVSQLSLLRHSYSPNFLSFGPTATIQLIKILATELNWWLQTLIKIN